MLPFCRNAILVSVMNFRYYIRLNRAKNPFLVYKVRDEETTKYGILEIDQNDRVINFKEKPKSEETKSRLGPGVKFLMSEKFIILDQY